MRVQLLDDIILHSHGERDAQRYFEQYPEVLYLTLSTSSTPHVAPQVKIGEKIADFVVAEPFSGGWVIKIIELEPPDDKMFTKNHKASERLNGALTQISDWMIYIDENTGSFIRSLSGTLARKNLLTKEANERTAEPTDSCGWRMSDSRSTHLFEYFVIISAAERLNDEFLKLKSHYKKHREIEILTYDRFRAQAKMCDKYSYIFDLKS